MRNRAGSRQHEQGITASSEDDLSSSRLTASTPNPPKPAKFSAPPQLKHAGNSALDTRVKRKSASATSNGGGASSSPSGLSASPSSPARSGDTPERDYSPPASPLAASPLAASPASPMRGAARLSASRSKSLLKIDAKPRAPRTQTLTENLHDWLFDGEDGAYMVAFRVLWGLCMAYEMSSLLSNRYTKIYQLYVQPIFHFKYYGFEWVQALAYDQTVVLCWVLFYAAIFISAGVFYRLASITFFLGFTYLYLVDMVVYLNHFYLVSLICFTLVFTPASRLCSIDSLIWPHIKRQSQPKWVRKMYIGLIFGVYIHAGLCKINDDWLRGEPLRHWLANRSHLPIFGPYLAHDIVGYLFSYTALFFDLLVCPALLYRRTRPVAIVLSFAFHLMNKFLFNIGIFPWVMLSTLCFFIEPSFYRSALDLRPLSPAAISNEHCYPLFEKLTKSVKSPRRAAGPTTGKRTPPRLSRPSARKRLSIGEWLIVIFLVCFFLYNFVFPLRHLAYPGDVAWNEYGHLFAWRMKLRDKSCEAEWYLYDQETRTNMTFSPTQFLTPNQHKKLLSRPPCLVQIARFVSSQTAYLFHGRYPEVHAKVMCSLNYRPQQLFIKPEYNLAAVEPWDWPYPFLSELEPLDEDLRNEFPWRALWSWSNLGSTAQQKHAIENQSVDNREEETCE